MPWLRVMRPVARTWWPKVTEPLSATFGTPFAEQLAALRLRLANKVGTATWTDLVKSEHDRAFVVAGAMKADLLDDLAKAVDRAIGDHRSLEQFRADFRQIVATRGWHGWTGEGTPKGEAWRTKVIYRTNMATSYAAGRLAQIKAANYKFWIYKHGNAVEPRLQHLAWDGVALPPDHPFWQTHAPPNGWGCTCRLSGAYSERGIKAAGGVPGKVLPDGWNTINPKTGASVGIDKGWDYKVGDTVSGEVTSRGQAATDAIKLVQPKIESLPAELGSDLGTSLAPAIDDAWAKWVEDTLASDGRTKPGFVGVISADVIKALSAKAISPQTAAIQVRPGLLAGPKAIRHESAGNALSPDDWLQLPQRLRRPLAVMFDKKSGNLLYVLQAEGGRAQIAVSLNYRMKGMKDGMTTNMVVSAYRTMIAEVLRRVANGTLDMIWGEVR